MAGLTPSPDISPVSAATSNGLFPQDSFCLNLSALPDSSNFMLKSALRSPHLIGSPNGLFFGGTGLNSYRKRPRNMSQSSGTDREMSTNSTPPATHHTGSTAAVSTISNGTHSEQRPPNKKRPSTDTIDYPRRRATIAVLQASSCNAHILTSAVRDMPVTEIKVRRHKAKMQTLHGAQCRMHLPGTRHQAGRRRQADPGASEPHRRTPADEPHQHLLTRNALADDKQRDE